MVYSNNANGDATHKQVLTTDLADAVIVNERFGDQAFDHSYANFNNWQSADASQNFKTNLAYNTKVA